MGTGSELSCALAKGAKIMRVANTRIDRAPGCMKLPLIAENSDPSSIRVLSRGSECTLHWSGIPGGCVELAVARGIRCGIAGKADGLHAAPEASGWDCHADCGR